MKAKQLSLLPEFDRKLDLMELRVRGKREFRGMLLDVFVFRRILERLRDRDRSAQMELMQLEYEIRSGNKESAMQRLERIKVMLGCLLLALTLSSLCKFSPVMRGRSRGAGPARLVRVTRGSRVRRNEFYFDGEECSA